MKKTAITNAIRAFIAQRSGIDFRDYASGNYQHSRTAFMQDYRPILKHGKDARTFLDYVETCDGISAEDLQDAFCGRISLVEKGGKVAVQYIIGQYFPTEYRRAACAALSQAVWNYWNDEKTGANDIRKRASRRFGRGIASRWFK
jgi:hypothetical protein